MLNRDTTLGRALRDIAQSRPTQEALVCGATRLTYAELAHRVALVARDLHGRGVSKGDRVVLLLPPGPEFAVFFFAAAELGAVAVPLGPQTRARQLGEVLQDAEPVALVTEQALELSTLLAPASLRHVIHAGSLAQAGPATIEQQEGPGPIASPEASVSPDDLLTLLYTSGTAGRPKATMHTHRSLIAPVIASIKLRELWMRRPGLKQLGQMAVAVSRYGERLLRAAGRPQTFLSTVGWHTITGLEVMLQGLLMGDRLVVMQHFHPREALELVERERVTVLVAVPTIYQVLLSLDGLEKYDTSSLLICGTGAAPCPPHLAREIQQKFGCAVHIGFGATETAGGISATSLADSDERQAETVGRPMPGVEVRIVDDERRDLPPGQIGELACRSEGVMLGYYRAPDMSAQVLDDEGWYYTGDLAMLDDKGYLHIVGRKKDVILRGGQTIYPAEIEHYLTAHPKIREAAVVGVPSQLEGESVWAFLVLESGEQISAQEVKDYCRAELEAFKIPSRVRFLDDLPRSETGKPRKIELRELALEEQKATDLV